MSRQFPGRTLPNKKVPDLGILPFDQKQPTREERVKRNLEARRGYLESRQRDIEMELKALDEAQNKPKKVEEPQKPVEPILVPVKKEKVEPPKEPFVLKVDPQKQRPQIRNTVINKPKVEPQPQPQPISNITKKTSSKK